MIDNRGHNEAPESADPLIERLEEQYRDLAERLANLAAEPDRKRTAHEMDFALRCRALRQDLKEAHDAEKAPFLEAGRKVDAWHAGLADLLRPIEVAALARIELDLRSMPGGTRLRSANGGIASLGKGKLLITFEEGTSWVEIAYDILPFVPADALQSALEAYVAEYGAPPAGVTVTPTTRLSLK